MTSSTYAKACAEVIEVIKHFPIEEYEKIPKEKIDFYKNNMDKNYYFSINPKLNIEKQNISPEANAIIVNLYQEYFATDEQKIKIKEILELNQRKVEQEKRNKYNPNDIFREKDKDEKNLVKPLKNSNNMALIKHKESVFTKLKKFIFKILNISKD